jgi:hypothetical protein
MELYLMPRPGGTTETVTRDAVLALFATNHLAILETETESSPDGTTFWRLVLEDKETRLHFQERQGRLCFATLEHYLASNVTLVDRACTVLEDAGWEVDSENFG